jgi:hypothetical protein
MQAFTHRIIYIYIYIYIYTYIYASVQSMIVSDALWLLHL